MTWSSKTSACAPYNLYLEACQFAGEATPRKFFFVLLVVGLAGAKKGGTSASFVKLGLKKLILIKKKKIETG
jgi:hypothetical protein